MLIRMRVCLYGALKYETHLINTSNNMDISTEQKTNFNVWHRPVWHLSHVSQSIYITIREPS